MARRHAAWRSSSRRRRRTASARSTGTSGEASSRIRCASRPGSRAIELPHLIEADADGELAGTGRWRFFAGRETAVTYEWNVRTTRAWMNLVAPVARPVFRWNHNAVMHQGGEGLADLLGAQAARRHVACCRCACSSPAAPASSAPTSPSGSWPRATTFACSTSSPTPAIRRTWREPGSSSSSATSATPMRSRRRRRAATRSSTSPPRRTSTGRSSARPTSAGRSSSEPRSCSRRCAAAARGFVQVSTDEVYGDLAGGGSSVETDPIKPSSPYSVAKAAGDLHIPAYARTFGVNASITRGSNTYGPNQYPEKLIPLMTTNAIEGEPLPVYGDGKQVRDWLWVEDHCAGHRDGPARGRSGRGLQRRRPRRARERRDRRPHPPAHRRRRVADPPRRGPRRPRPPLFARHDASCAGSAGSRRSRSTEGIAETVALVPRAPQLVGADQVRRVPRRTTRSSTRLASPAS